MEKNAFDRLCEQYQRDWTNLRSARVAADQTTQRIATVLNAAVGKPTSSDEDLVVFGSLARGEWTSQSDLDWTLLLDGQANPDHRRVAQQISASLKDSFNAPGTTGTFGSLSFSHDLVHLIGGQSDTNINTTQRILLLLESTRVAFGPDATVGSSATAHERVLRNILYRYLLDDTNLVSPEGAKGGVPRFLLNDIVRFWRTMCVDFAWKGWEQAGKKWALRNLKLRMSRKLIFVSGLLICAFPFLHKSMLNDIQEQEPDARAWEVASLLLPLAKQVPIDVLSDALIHYGSPGIVAEILDAYDAFLAVLNDEEKRQHLENLQPQSAYADSLFQEGRNLSHAFQKGLTSLFFDTKLADFTRTYGVF